jgi:signal transduction histidine kinase
MNPSMDVNDPSASLEAILTTEELERRPSRPADYEAENSALVALAQEMTNSPTSVLQKLVDAALRLCRAHSAGISLLEDGAERKIFRWHAVAGEYAPYVWGTTWRDFSPCGTVLDRDAMQLMSHPERYFTYFAPITPLIVEALLIPFYVGGQAVGTIWVISHDEQRRFDGEDARMITSLGKFASAAHQILASLDVVKAVQAKLEKANAELLQTNETLNAHMAEREASQEALRRSEGTLREQTRELEEQLIATGRLVSLGEITASMAHEFNNPLGIVMGFAEDLLSEKAATDPDYEPLRIISEETKRCEKIIRNLLDYSRPRKMEMQPTDIGELVEKSLGMVANHLYRHKIAAAFEAVPDLPAIHADPQQIEQVMVNLFLNAIDAMPEGGTLSLKVARDSDAQVVIAVTDTGYGIGAEDLGKIFLPFFSARKTTGLGLGLPICQRIVKNHGGRIEVESRSEQGTSFRIYLPLGRESAPAVAADGRDATI